MYLFSLQNGQSIEFISSLWLYIGKLEQSLITSALTSFSIFVLSLEFSESPSITFVIRFPTNLNSLA